MIVMLGALVCAALLIALRPAPAKATCVPGNPATCLPGSGYTYNQTWNCGSIYLTQECYFNATLGRSFASAHSWSWGSADYDGVGPLTVCFEAGTQAQSTFGACGSNLARACWDTANCNDTNASTNWVAGVFHDSPSGNPFTVLGHAEA